MIKTHKPCHCDICERDRYYSECLGCGGHPSFHRTVIESPQWKLWQVEQERRMKNFSSAKKGFAKNDKQTDYGIYDMAEVEECGHISQEHFQGFLKFVVDKH